MADSRAFLLLLVCFFFSGVAALVYETAWTTEFAFVFGTSELAVALVLAAYMAGLALGAAAIDRVLDRIRSTVAAYGLLELGIAVSAFLVPHAIALSRTLYVALFLGGGDLGEGPGELLTAVFFAGTALLVLLIPTAMMGATLPLLARHLVHEERQIGARIGLLYGGNTLGAVVGALLTAFVLLPDLGLRSTIHLAAGLNALAFLLAWRIARSGGADQPVTPHPGLHPATVGARWVGVAMMVSGTISFAYEVVWVRLLEHLLGSSIQAFGIILGSFLLGIALGSALASRTLMTRNRAAIGFCTAQLGIGVLTWLALRVADEIPVFAQHLSRFGLRPALVHVVACLVTLLPPAMCIGATFPLAVRLHSQDAAAAGRSSARVYAWNTVGSIVGSIGAAFLLLPALGFAGTITLCLAGNLGLALITLLFGGQRPAMLVVVTPLLAFALIALPPETPWGLLTASTMESVTDPTSGRIRYLGVGRSATVLLRDLDTSWRLRTNGLPEADVAKPHAWPNAFPLTRWLTALPVLVRPDTARMLVIGLGGGTALEEIPPTVRRIDVIELEPEVVEANRLIGDQRWRDPLRDPRVRIHVNDARNSLLLADPDRVRLDAIVSQPSHPWSGGAAHLYTQEFFELVESRLSPRGVFLQWLGTGFVDEALLRSLLAALQNVFEHVEVFQPPPGLALLFVCSNESIDIARNAERALEESPASFERLGLHEPGEVLSMLRLDGWSVRELAAGAQPVRDENNRLQVRSERLGRSSMAQDGRLFAAHEPLSRLVETRSDGLFILRQLIPFRIPRLLTVSSMLPRVEDRMTLEALADVALGRRQSARRLLRAVLADVPTHVEARAAMLLLSRAGITRGESVERFLELPLTATEDLLIRAWQSSSQTILRDQAGTDLDASLGAIERIHPLRQEAARIRIRWRLERGDEVSIREALRISEASLGPQPTSSDLLLHARLESSLGHYAIALDLIRHAALRLVPEDAQTEAHLHEAKRLLREVPARNDLDRLRSIVESAIGERAG